VHLVDDVNFEAALRRRVTNVVPQLAHVVDPAIARCVQLNNIEAVSNGDFAAIITFAARRYRRAVDAIEGFCQDARG
jgi:hypothetical protein